MPKPKMKKRKVTPERDQLFDIICFYMGQGDCSLIRCPNGKIVMIDCGSTYDFDKAYQQIVVDQVRDPAWAGGNASTIDALILTHKDADHCNQLVNVLGAPNLTGTPAPKLKIDKVYFSWAKSDTEPLGWYSGLGQTMANDFFNTSELCEVTICSEDDNKNFSKKWTSADRFRNVVTDSTGNAKVPIANRKFTLFNGTAAGKNWSVSLIAGNVQQENGSIDTDILGEDENGEAFEDDAEEQNARSLITLLEIGTKKALFCGDATFSTEYFLVKSQSALIRDAQFITAPHHGSEKASSTGFVNIVKPEQVAVSAGFNEHRHLHPRETAIKRWLTKVSSTDNHDIDYWEIDTTKANNTYNSWLTKSLKVDPSASGNFYTLDGIPIANTYYGVKNAGLLYRAEVSVDLWETAFIIDTANPTTPGQFLHYEVG